MMSRLKTTDNSRMYKMIKLKVPVSGVFQVLGLLIFQLFVFILFAVEPAGL